MAKDAIVVGGIGKPPVKKPATAKPAKAAQTQNTTKAESGAVVDLNFKVDAEFKREFKLFAAAHDMSQKAVLERAFQLLKDSVS